MTKIYAGIGSRKTPAAILEFMTNVATELSEMGWLLRSGAAPGADKAFEAGAKDELKEIFLPWQGFDGFMKPGHILPTFGELHYEIASASHPAWHLCTIAARQLHMRNVCQVLGEDCKAPANMVVCWTEEGRGSGGTGQALRIARRYGIPVFDLGLKGDQQKLIDFVVGQQ